MQMQQQREEAAIFGRRAVGLVQGVVLSLFVAGGAVGCATASSTKDFGPIESLVGTTWKLPLSETGLDGRKIEFKMGDNGHYHAVLTSVGLQLQQTVGAYEGLVLMELVPDSTPNTFRGFERIPGRPQTEIRCSVSEKGSELKCSTQSTPWQRES